VSALLLATVFGTRGETGVALSADGLLTVVPLSQKSQRGIVDSSSQTQDKMQCALLLDVVVGEGTAILELLSSEDKTLLIRRDTFFILNLGLHIVDGVGGLDIKGDGLAREGLNEDLHGERCSVFVDNA
jgi:hypothetical protein